MNTKRLIDSILKIIFKTYYNKLFEICLRFYTFESST